nr:NADH dehydrogenase subunit 4L [Heterochaerus australis]
MGMFKFFFLITMLMVTLGNFFMKASVMVLLLFLEIAVLSVVMIIIYSSETILSAFNLSITFMVFGVIAATLGLTLLSSVFKSEDPKSIQSQLL